MQLDFLPFLPDPKNPVDMTYVFVPLLDDTMLRFSWCDSHAIGLFNVTDKQSAVRDKNLVLR